MELEAAAAALGLALSGGALVIALRLPRGRTPTPDEQLARAQAALDQELDGMTLGELRQEEQRMVALIDACRGELNLIRHRISQKERGRG